MIPSYSKKTVLLLKTFVVFSLSLVSAGCGETDPMIVSGPFYCGFDSLPWGSRLSALDSTLQADTQAVLISRIPNLTTQGLTLVIRKNKQDYYLDYNSRHELSSFSYFSYKDSLNTMDTLNFRLTRHYGEPELQVRQAYSKQTWKAPHTGSELSIQLIITGQRYSLTVVHQLFSD